jgi:neutral ceramidase
MKKIILILPLAALFALGRAQAGGPRSTGRVSADGSLLAGTARINITPKTDEPIHDSIYARSLVLEDKGVRIAFVAVDLAVFTSDRLEQICREKFGITRLMLSSSHNHSEPQPGGKRSFQGNPYTAFYEDQIVKAVDQAVHHLFPARITAGRRRFPQLGFNRLIVREDGHARESWFSDDHYTSENPERIPFGPVDPEVGVIRIDDQQGEPKAIIMNYACHADIVCFNYAVSADYPGVACRKVEEAFGGTVNCLFIQGAGGNIESLQISSRRKGPNDPFQTDYAPMERTGELLAYETIKLARGLPAAPAGQELRYMEDSMHFTGRFNKKLDYDVHLATLLIGGNIAIAVCPGELFVQLGLNWKKQMELAEVQPFLFGYTWSQGKWPGYVADVRSAALGGYGADQGDNLIEPGAGEAMMTRQLVDFYRLNGLMRDHPGPVGFKSGSQWVIKPFQADSTKKH